MFSRFVSRIRNFAKDQGGMEALQTICLIAIAAMIMIGAVSIGNQGKSWMSKEWKGLQTEAKEKPGGGDTDTTDDGEADEEVMEFPEDDLSDVSGDSDNPADQLE